MTQQPPTFQRFLFCFCGAAFLVLATVTHAAEREHGAHEHGVSRLNVAIENRTVEIELISPGADIVGFEHAAKSVADKEAISGALMALKDGLALFVFPAKAGCRLEEAEVESELAEEHQYDHKKKEEDHKHEHEKGDEDTHAEFHAHYHFHCNEPSRVSHIDVKLFERFPTLREVDVHAITSRGQSATELTPVSARLMF